jgi:hypothetical protein
VGLGYRYFTQTYQNGKFKAKYPVSSTMQITSAMKMVSAAAKESTRCDYSHASLCRKINGTITKPFCDS